MECIRFLAKELKDVVFSVAPLVVIAFTVPIGNLAGLTMDDEIHDKK